MDILINHFHITSISAITLTDGHNYVNLQWTQDVYVSNGEPDERWIISAPAYAETLVGVGNLPDSDVTATSAGLAWGEVYEIDEQLAMTAADIADEVGPQGPFLGGMDALIAAVGRDLDAPVVVADADLTHDATKQVIAVEEYR
jgi:predicted nucleic acid-binding protein